MTLSLTHAFVSPIADEGDAGLVGPDEWNAGHTLTMATARLLGRTTAGTGAVEELTAAGVRSFLNVEDGATADQSAAEILAALLTVDGSGSGLDADLLDGQSSAAFATAAHTHPVADLSDASANGRSLISAADYAAMVSLLGLVIGTNVQAFDADLTTWAGLTPSANAQSLVTAADYAAMRALLDLEAGTDFLSPAAIAAAYQPLDADLTAIAALTTTAAGLSMLTIADPGADRVVAWDDTAGGMAAIALADITAEAAPAAGDFLLIYGAEGDLRKVDWDDLPSGSGIANVVEDLTPQLGGDLDLNGHVITGMVIGTNVQAWDAQLDSLSAASANGVSLVTAADYAAMVALLEADIESAIDTLANLTSVQGLTVTLADAGADAVFGWDDSAGAYENLTATEVRVAIGLATTDSPEFAALNIGAATDTTITRTAAGKIAVEGVAILTGGKHTMQLWPGSFLDPDASAPEYLKVSATNLVAAWGFDASADESLWIAFRAPKSSDESAGFTFDYTWSHAATVTNFGVAMFLELVAVGNAELLSTAMGTAVEVDDTGGTTNNVYISPESGTVTPGNTWAEGDLIIGRLYRDVSDAADTLAVDMRLHNFNIYITLNAANDA